jgi:hypothetical protein
MKLTAKNLVNDELWQIVKPVLPAEPPKPKGDRPRLCHRAALSTVPRANDSFRPDAVGRASKSWNFSVELPQLIARTFICGI